jgi:hypothetical protein
LPFSHLWKDMRTGVRFKILNRIKKTFPRMVLRARIVRQSIREVRVRRLMPSARSLIVHIESVPDSPFNKIPRDGHLRGIDFYSRNELIRAVATTIANYKLVHGRQPDLLSPKTFNEKICWSKFFREFRIPDSGNKLRTSSFIPPHLHGTIKCPKIIWHSSRPQLPPNQQIRAGVYYLKANHGSGMVKRVSFPLHIEDRLELEALANEWLNNPFGLATGEWWYAVFEREIILEEAVGAEENTTTFNFHVFAGEVAMISCYKKDLSGAGADLSMLLDPKINVLPFCAEEAEPMCELPFSMEAGLKLRRIAGSIAKQFEYARVDFLLDEQERPFLGEVTFAPGDGMFRWPANVDSEFGSKWALTNGPSGNLP